MSNRVTDSEVRAIMPTLNVALTDLTPFITAAHLLIQRVIVNSPNALSVPSPTEEELKEVERWLGAHFVAINDPVTNSEGAGGVSAGYMLGTPGQCLMATPFGQQAVALDFTGQLALLNTPRKKCSITIIDPIGTAYPSVS